MQKHAANKKQTAQRKKLSAVAGKYNGLSPLVQFEDNRRESIIQRRLDRLTNVSPKALDLRDFQDKADILPNRYSTLPLQLAWDRQGDTFLWDRLTDGVAWFADLAGKMWFHISNADGVVQGNLSRYQALEGQKKTWQEWNEISIHPHPEFSPQDTSGGQIKDSTVSAFKEAAPPPKEMSYEWLKSIGLSQGEISALQQYTTALYQKANKYLRSGIDDDNAKDIIGRLMEGTRVDDDRFEKLAEEAGYVYSREKADKWIKVFKRYLELIVSGMSKLPEPSQTEVSRGINLVQNTDFFDKHTAESIITDPGFMSTAFGTPFAKNSIIQIILPKGHPGRDISKLSAFGQESEILFPPGTGYKIREIIDKEDQRFTILMEKFVPDPDDRKNRFRVVEQIFITDLVPPSAS